ncbi:ABC transporter [Spartobacteria bacterium LR76]|nr:ABC transporter [Spartobacteria bacterium LR76]
MSELIRIENVSKRYRLGTINRGMLVKDLQSWWARKRGKEDPHAVIGEHQNRIEKGSEFWALRDINFSINAGDTLGVIGRNGAGKSTLLKILSRTTSPTSGVIKTRGRISSLLEVGTGFHPELTGRENVFLNGAILGMSQKEVRRKFDEIVEFSEIAEFIDTPVKRYSSGMYVRLAFAVAAHLDPEVLIVDEVLAVGDANFQRKCIGKMGKVAKEGRTVILVSHSMVLVENLTKKCLWLHDGQMRMAGESKEVASAYLKYTQNLQIGVAEGLHDYRLRRGDGRVRLEDFKVIGPNGEIGNQHRRGTTIRFRSRIRVLRRCEDLAICLSFKLGLSGEHIMSTRRYRLNDEPLAPDTVIESTLEVDTTALPSALYDLYIWLGPSVEQTVDEYYDIVDGMVTPLQIHELEDSTRGDRTELKANILSVQAS